MLNGDSTSSKWWLPIPVRQVTYLGGVDPELLRIALDPLPAGAPAIIQFRPQVRGPLGDQVSLLLDELDRAAISLFPSWLPSAEQLDGARGLGIAAVRALATQAAARSAQFGPFLADLAEKAVSVRNGQTRGSTARFPAEVRASGLARVLADAYGRDAAALLVEIPAGLGEHDELTLTAAAEWFARHANLSVWLAGEPLRAADSVSMVSIVLPRVVTALVDITTVEVRGHEDSAVDVLSYAPLSGVPAWNSDAEQALERALRPHEWARGRRWNHTYEWSALGKPYRLDLVWEEEGVIVEVDGDEHRGPLQFADDRRRDTQLQLLGHNVLRFTNEQVLFDTQAAASIIKQILCRRRADRKHEIERQHVDC